MWNNLPDSVKTSPMSVFKAHIIIYTTLASTAIYVDFVVFQHIFYYRKKKEHYFFEKHEQNNNSTSSNCIITNSEKKAIICALLHLTHSYIYSVHGALVITPQDAT